ncbi:MAG: tetratricopeptide (TPR) repeat protein [Lysobacterales bacterium]|jgi:tetratricopeptide (TPR) repeat protein
MHQSISSANIFLSIIAATVLFSGQALAQDACGIERDVSVSPLDEPTWKRMNDVYEDIAEENYDLAYQKLLDMTERSRGGVYLQAIVQQLLGQVEWARENFDASLAHFEEAVALNSLPDLTHYSLMYQIAQLFYMQDRFDDSLRSLNLWMCKVPAENVKASAHILKASLYAAKEDWANVIPSVNTAIEMSDTPTEGWYQLKLAAHHEVDDKVAARDTLKIIINFWPEKKAYWIQLSNLYFQLENDLEALSVAVLAHRKNLLDKQSDYLYLSNMYSLREVPFKSAQVLQEGIEKGIVEPTEKHWRMIADSWFSAEEMENALVAYEKAGAAALDGEIDLRRGYILVDLERWGDAKIALQIAIDKGGIDERKLGEAHLMVGMSEFNLDNFEAATEAWNRAMKFEKTKEAARQWKAHAREEKARKAP